MEAHSTLVFIRTVETHREKVRRMYAEKKAEQEKRAWALARWILRKIKMRTKG